MSGSLQGAGGVGGLLAISEGESHRFPAYDANGNVSQLVDESGAITAAYTYDPFGNVTEMAGLQAEENPWRFSTKPVDSGTGWLYYGYRYYDPGTGRWLNRDPIGERGGINLYGFVRNDGVGYIDSLGLIVYNDLLNELETINTPKEIFERFRDLEYASARVEDGRTITDKNLNYLLTCFCGIIDLRHFGMGLRDVHSGSFTPEEYMIHSFEREWSIPRPSSARDRANKILTWRNNRVNGGATSEDHPSEALGALAGSRTDWKRAMIAVFEACGADKITRNNHNAFIAKYGDLASFVRGRTNALSAPILVDQELNSIGKCCPDRKDGQNSLQYFQQNSGLIWNYIEFRDPNPRNVLNGQPEGPGTISGPSIP